MDVIEFERRIAHDVSSHGRPEPNDRRIIRRIDAPGANPRGSRPVSIRRTEPNRGENVKDRNKLKFDTSVKKAGSSPIMHQYPMTQYTTEDRSPFMHPIIHGSDAMKVVLSKLSKIAPVDVTVLILGERGTGKELLAQTIHGLSGRASGPFVAVDCPSIPDSLLEGELFGQEKVSLGGATSKAGGKIAAAHGGTLFLDEVGDLPLSAQVKLSRFMETHAIDRSGQNRPAEADVRVVCATHRNLEQLIVDGRFREDLYYRMNQVCLRVPAVRDRPGDATLIARYFLRRFAAEFERRLSDFSPGALRAIGKFCWSGNVREIQNRVRRAAIMSHGPIITAADLDLEDEQFDENPLDLRRARAEAEARVLELALEKAGSNLSKAAKLLGVSRPTLYSLMRQHASRASFEIDSEPCRPRQFAGASADLQHRGSK